uniref:Uncharacterized protein n=1 Tax=Neospora caninum (strain Liverpool) TaxID=572307 RepID=A0A0F7UN95_NEOCL|nr:TPA: hypothetical protein BN1204_061635 [Neospora caninum Liverpool]
MSTPRATGEPLGGPENQQQLLLRPCSDPPFISIWTGKALVVFPFTDVIDLKHKAGNGSPTWGIASAGGVPEISTTTSLEETQLPHAAKSSCHTSADYFFPHSFAPVDNLFNRMCSSSQSEQSGEGTEVYSWVNAECGINQNMLNAEHLPLSPINHRHSRECCSGYAAALATGGIGNQSTPAAPADDLSLSQPPGCPLTNNGVDGVIPASVESVVILGPVGSGKTFVRTHAMKYAVWRYYKSVRARGPSVEGNTAASSPGVPADASDPESLEGLENEIVEACNQLAAMNILIRAFLHAPVPSNSSSTRCCLIVEMRLAWRSTVTPLQLSGGFRGGREKIQLRLYPILLAPGGLAKPLAGERKSFHIFELLSDIMENPKREGYSDRRFADSAGPIVSDLTTPLLTEEIRQAAWLRKALHNNLGAFPRLSASGAVAGQRNIPPDREDDRWPIETTTGSALVRWALRTVGFTREEMSYLFRLLQVIQTLGDLDFRDNLATSPAHKANAPRLQESDEQLQLLGNFYGRCEVSVNKTLFASYKDQQNFPLLMNSLELPQE